MIKIITRILLFFMLVFVTKQMQAQSVGGTTSGAATYCASTNSGFLSLTGYTGSILNWESSVDGGLTWLNIGNVTSTQSYLNLSTSTCYRAIVQSGIFPPDTSTISCITIYAPSNGGSIAGGGTFCSGSGTGTLLLSGNTGSVLFWQSSTDGGLTWTSISDTTTSYNYSGITINTIFSAVVQNATCPSDTSSTATFIIVPASIGGIVSLNDTVCSGANAGTLTLSGNNGSVTGWIASTDGGTTWSSIPGTASTEPYSSLTQTTLFAAIVQNAACTPDTSSAATITVLPLPIISAGNDTTLLPGQTIVLQGSGNGSPFWSPSTYLDSVNIYMPTSSPLNSITYTLTVTDSNGCINSDAIVITVAATSFNGAITTLFTPNNDGVNDFWHIEGIENYPENEITVYNIHGQKVFAQTKYMNDWAGTFNGHDLPDGTYFYVLKFKDGEPVFKGSLDILRKK